jgi:hypothetical protein
VRELNREGDWVDPDDSSLPGPKRSRHDLLAIARYQKAILLCILFHLSVIAALCALAALDLIPPAADVVMWVGFPGLALVEAVLMFLLATRVFGTGAGIVLGILTLLPCIGLVALLVINGRASATLKGNGIRVGLLGVSGQDIRRLRAEH